jgi:hypothetical protein
MYFQDILTKGQSLKYHKLHDLLNTGFFTSDADYTCVVSKTKIYTTGKRRIFFLLWSLSKLRAVGLTDCIQINLCEIYFVLLNFDLNSSIYCSYFIK